jgi:hypothetical protein
LIGFAAILLLGSLVWVGWRDSSGTIKSNSSHDSQRIQPPEFRPAELNREADSINPPTQDAEELERQAKERAQERIAQLIKTARSSPNNFDRVEAIKVLYKDKVQTPEVSELMLELTTDGDKNVRGCAFHYMYECFTPLYATRPEIAAYVMGAMETEPDRQVRAILYSLLENFARSPELPTRVEVRQYLIDRAIVEPDERLTLRLIGAIHTYPPVDPIPSLRAIEMDENKPIRVRGEAQRVRMELEEAAKKG